MKKFLLKVNDWLVSNIDKIAHFTISGLLTYVILAVLVLTNSMFYFALFSCITVGIVLAIGIVKEILDIKWKNSSADIWDIAAGLVGSIATIGFILLSRLIFV